MSRGAHRDRILQKAGERADPVLAREVGRQRVGIGSKSPRANEERLLVVLVEPPPRADLCKFFGRVAVPVPARGCYRTDLAEKTAVTLQI